ncbi:MAG: UDP-4-amino-4,6-dideoxy-N-acetyl-beta-L-altrosamine transaminase [Verrucomicrobiota bacterium]
MKLIPYGRQSISEEDIAAVGEALRSDFLACGPRAEEFERRIAELVGAKHAVAMNSATSALHIAMRVAGVGPGHRVVTSPNTFLASANCAAFVGGTPDFSDIDSVSYNLDPIGLERSWQLDTKAVVAVDYAGQPCDLPAIAQVARARGAIVIEDACHAVGGSFLHEGRAWKLGGHPWADMTVFSFHPVKTMTTGEGGMLVTNNDDWAGMARQLRSHGVERKHFLGLGADDEPAFAERGPWHYEMQNLGYNYRITDIQCALGLSQLSRLETFIERRREIVASYNSAFAGIPWLTLPRLRAPADAALVSWHLYTIQIDFRAIGRTRTEVMVELYRQGVGTQVLYIPVHLQPWFRQTYGYARGKCPVAEAYYARALSLPLYPAMTAEDVARVQAAVRALA